MNDDLNYWKNLAIYLCDVHAANAEGISLKRLPKHEKKRQIFILQKCVSGLAGNFHDPYPSNLTDVIKRCEKNQKLYLDSDTPKT